jgi:DsbC/DsbD-like thiol-disulfide interchange protein
MAIRLRIKYTIGMTTWLLRQWVATAATVGAAACCICLAFGAAQAADASLWDGDARSAVRLVAGNAAADQALRAGIELRLAAGWKTYWRYPGDSGVPPVFDFSKSENVKSVAVEWPAPHRFTDDGGATIGYKTGVLLPLRVVPENPQRPVRLRLNLDYAVCERLCVPAKGAAQLELGRGPSPHDAALAAAEAHVPAQSRLGESGPLAIRSVRREPGNPHPRVIVEVAAPASAPLDLFVEGPTEEWALPLPDPVDGAPPLRRFAFELDGLPPGADPAAAAGARLRFTLVSGERAIEVTAPLE